MSIGLYNKDVCRQVRTWEQDELYLFYFLFSCIRTSETNLQLFFHISLSAEQDNISVADVKNKVPLTK